MIIVRTNLKNRQSNLNESLENEPASERVTPREDEAFKSLRFRMEKHPERSETGELTEENEWTEMLKNTHLEARIRIKKDRMTL